MDAGHPPLARVCFTRPLLLGADPRLNATSWRAQDMAAHGCAILFGQPRLRPGSLLLAARSAVVALALLPACSPPHRPLESFLQMARVSTAGPRPPSPFSLAV